MALLGSFDDVTLISLVLALVALALTFVSFLVMRRRIGDLKLVEKGIDAYALVQEFSQRSKRLEERLVDQQVKLEILELRQKRTGTTVEPLSDQGRRAELQANYQSQGEERSMASPNEQVLDRSFRRTIQSGTSVYETRLQPSQVPSRLGEEEVTIQGRGLVRSETEALRFVMESGGASAKDIQRRIGRSREHSARMMNSLFKEGYVERNSETRPFSYKITEKGREAALSNSATE